MSRDGLLSIESKWQATMAAAGLDSFAALMQGAEALGKLAEQCQCLTTHTRSQTLRLTLRNGQVIFLKRDFFTHLKQLAWDLLCLRRPQPLTEKERQAMMLLAGLRVRTPEIIAHGHKRRWGLAWQGVLVTAAVEGVPLSKYVPSTSDHLLRRATLAAVGRQAARIYSASFSMPDFRPKHVFITDSGELCMLDVDRVRTCRYFLEAKKRRQVARFCRELQKYGADDEDRQAFLRGLDGADGLTATSPALSRPRENG